MFQFTADSIGRLTPPRRMGSGRIAPSLKGGITGKVVLTKPGLKRQSP